MEYGEDTRSINPSSTTTTKHLLHHQTNITFSALPPTKTGMALHTGVYDDNPSFLYNT
ncbi:hypothetical protein IMZ48_14285 [Candidatus Bathyarchaeota archaeon]|nr:hypothetical protein [Candidatus Bathyarchaeota archaeon]